MKNQGDGPDLLSNNSFSEPLFTPVPFQGERRVQQLMLAAMGLFDLSESFLYKFENAQI